MEKYIFPEGFLWGSATSAFQVEGECSNHDFYNWAVRGLIKDKSNPFDAVMHYKKYKEDIGLMKMMNHNAARIGLEWARIEPCENRFDDSALQHYRDELSIMKKEGILAMVTLHHFANPMWFAKIGSWENPKSIDFFLTYVKKVVEFIGDLVDFYITINEPTVLAYKGYFEGDFPPGKKNLLLMKKVNNVLSQAHISAYNLIHNIYIINGWNRAKIGVSKHMRTFDPYNPNSFLDRLSSSIINSIINYEFLGKVCNVTNFQGNTGTLDFLGLNYYTGDLVKFPFKTLGRDELKKNKLGWDIYPHGFYRILREVWSKYHMPIYITENGTCDDNDEIREDYIRQHIKAMYRALQEGVDIKGYFHWSTMDNFELTEGLSARFGLIHVDHDSIDKKRTIKDSGRFYANIIKNNGLIE